MWPKPAHNYDCSELTTEVNEVLPSTCVIEYLILPFKLGVSAY